MDKSSSVQQFTNQALKQHRPDSFVHREQQSQHQNVERIDLVGVSTVYGAIFVQLSNERYEAAVTSY
jgi:hypothetical protein